MRKHIVVNRGGGRGHLRETSWRAFHLSTPYWPLLQKFFSRDASFHYKNLTMVKFGINVPVIEFIQITNFYKSYDRKMQQ